MAMSENFRNLLIGMILVGIINTFAITQLADTTNVTGTYRLVLTFVPIGSVVGLLFLAFKSFSGKN